ncbi:vitamin K epoxide reductase family protein [Nocardioides dongxiaopingii]|uniref:vitamin K epoxide reductase family protein n=1 Tax=Nocardioides sp. S-1144 TaxID=2582905 RepID=UPI0021CB9108|nr:vitamin K epoxide reductase family protein [Nocardioides sp. S-1144]
MTDHDVHDDLRGDHRDDLDDDLDDEELRAELAAERAADHQPRSFGIMLVVLGAAGLAAAFALAVDKYRILADPSYVPSCNLSPVLSCGSVMTTDQAEAFGFPNPLLGLVAFGVVVTLGVLIAAGVRLPGWVLGGLAVGGFLGAVFVHWLAFQSMYRIDALCPWCLVVWTVTLPIALWSVLLAARTGTPGLRRRARVAWSARFLVLTAWYLVFVVAALVRFWDYWRTLL